MSWNTDGALQRRVALVVIAALAVNPSMLVAAGPPAAAPPAAVARVGSVMVESEPAGAAVYVDGQLTGQTPLQVSGLSAGDHRVRLVKGGYLENARLVSVGAAANTVRVKLTRDAGSRPELAAQLGGGGGATGGGGGGSKLPLILALAGGGAVAAILIAKKGSDSSTNQPPTAGSITPSPTTGILNTNTTLTAVGASDPEGDALTYSWNFGDGTAAGTGASVTHVYTTAGTFTVTLTVTDAPGGSVSTTTSLVVKSLTFATWLTTWANFPSFTVTTNLTQSGTNLTGSFTTNAAFPGTVSGSINATTRQVTITYTCGTCGTWIFQNAVANAAVTTLTGPTIDVNSGFGGATGVMTRP